MDKRPDAAARLSACGGALERGQLITWRLPERGPACFALCSCSRTHHLPPLPRLARLVENHHPHIRSHLRRREANAVRPARRHAVEAESRGGFQALLPGVRFSVFVGVRVCLQRGRPCPHLYMVWNISFASCCRAASNAVTGLFSARSLGSG